MLGKHTGEFFEWTIRPELVQAMKEINLKGKHLLQKIYDEALEDKHWVFFNWFPSYKKSVQEYKGQAIKIMNALLGAGQMMFSKIIIFSPKKLGKVFNCVDTSRLGNCIYLNKNHVLYCQHDNMLELILNEKYIGTYKYKDIRIENAIPAIIDKETFDAVQKRMTKNKKTHVDAGGGMA